MEKNAELLNLASTKERQAAEVSGDLEKAWTKAIEEKEKRRQIKLEMEKLRVANLKLAE